MNWLSFFSGITLTPVITGLSIWLGKIWANRILEKDRAKYQTQMETLLLDLRTRDDKELYVHKLQFEKEFEIYKELWMKLLSLGRAGTKFRDLQRPPVDDTGNIINEFCDSYNAFKELVYSNRPFYAPKIYGLSKTVLDKARNVFDSIHRQERLERETVESAELDEKIIELGEKKEHDLNEINNLVDDMCTAIRERIWSTGKTGWDRNL